MNGKKGIILAGGKGKRLAPLTLTIPKPLVMVNNKPLINYNLGLFHKFGIGEVKIVIRAEDRTLYDLWHNKYASQFPSMVISFEEEKEPMGTLGYLTHHLTDWIGNEKIFVTNGDDIKDIDLENMFNFHNATDTAASIALMEMSDPGDYGSVAVDDGKITGFLEKEKSISSGLVSAGMYIINRRATTFVKAQTAPGQKFLMFEKDMFPLLAQNRDLGAFVCEGAFFDCGTPERLKNAEAFLSGNTETDQLIQ